MVAGWLAGREFVRFDIHLEIQFNFPVAIPLSRASQHVENHESRDEGEGGWRGRKIGKRAAGCVVLDAGCSIENHRQPPPCHHPPPRPSRLRFLSPSFSLVLSFILLSPSPSLFLSSPSRRGDKTSRCTEADPYTADPRRRPSAKPLSPSSCNSLPNPDPHHPPRHARDGRRYYAVSRNSPVEGGFGWCGSGGWVGGWVIWLGTGG